MTLQRGAASEPYFSATSEDAPAAERLCAALSGIAVWFDRSELRGGDVWDAAIRQQIRACALFVPIISVNTRARAEGYFRLEWKRAADRSDLIAGDKAPRAGGHRRHLRQRCAGTRQIPRSAMDTRRGDARLRRTSIPTAVSGKDALRHQKTGPIGEALAAFKPPAAQEIPGAAGIPGAPRTN
jgi:hypothetical protein